MSEKVTGLDYAMAESAWAAASDESPHGLAVHELSQHFAAHRIAATKAERERCVAKIRDRCAELPLQLQRSSHGHLLIKLADELAKDGE